MKGIKNPKKTIFYHPLYTPYDPCYFALFDRRKS
jgi:hypothetical protein